MQKLISAHSLVVASCRLDPMLEEKYQTLKQNLCNDIATCEVMLEPVISPMSSLSDKLEHEEKAPHEGELPTMDPTEKEFRERLKNMEQDKEIPAYITSDVIGKKELNYLVLKRKRVISDIETLNHIMGQYKLWEV